jgi:hypothetical protein
MSIAELHASFQHISIDELDISRNAVKDRALALSGKNKITIMKTAMDLQVCRGFYLSVTNTENNFVRQHGTDVIVIGRDQSKCWDRFIIVKELLHLFDDQKTATSDPEQFGTCLNELARPSGAPLSPAGRREWEAMWLAMSILCPENCRQHFIAELEAERLTAYDIALKLRVPVVVVPMLFDPRYEKLVYPLIKPAPKIVAAE